MVYVDADGIVRLTHEPGVIYDPVSGGFINEGDSGGPQVGGGSSYNPQPNVGGTSIRDFGGSFGLGSLPHSPDFSPSSFYLGGGGPRPSQTPFYLSSPAYGSSAFIDSLFGPQHSSDFLFGSGGPAQFGDSSTPFYLSPQGSSDPFIESLFGSQPSSGYMYGSGAPGSYDPFGGATVGGSGSASPDPFAGSTAGGHGSFSPNAEALGDWNQANQSYGEGGWYYDSQGDIVPFQDPLSSYSPPQQPPVPIDNPFSGATSSGGITVSGPASWTPTGFGHGSPYGAGSGAHGGFSGYGGFTTGLPTSMAIGPQIGHLGGMVDTSTSGGLSHGGVDPTSGSSAGGFLHPMSAVSESAGSGEERAYQRGLRTFGSEDAFNAAMTAQPQQPAGVPMTPAQIASANAFAIQMAHALGPYAGLAHPFVPKPTGH